MSTRRAVRIGLLGCADIALRRMVPAFRATAETTLVVVASRDPITARRVADSAGCAAAADYRSVLERPDVDAVYLPLPVALHAEWTERALRAGKHVLVEKPMTADPQDTTALLALAAGRGLVLRENVMFVHHAQHRYVRELVAEGAIGELRAFSAAFTVPALPPGNIRYRPELAGGALLDIGLYPLCAAQRFLGRDLAVVGAHSRTHRTHGVDIAGSALLAGPDDVTAQIVFGMDHSYRSGYELWGSTGSISVDRAFAPPTDHAPVLRLADRSGARDIRLEPDDQYVNSVRAFAAAVTAADTPPPPVDPVALARLMRDVRRAAAAPDRRGART